MRENSSNGNIDVDALVNALLQNRAEESTIEDEEKPILVTDIVRTMPSVENEADEENEEETVLITQVAPTAPPAEDEEKYELKPPRKKRFLQGLFHREEEPEEDEEELWADWGLKPIGHYHAQTEAEDTPHKVSAEKKIPDAEPTRQETLQTAQEPNLADAPQEAPAATSVSAEISPAPVVVTSAHVDEFPAVQAVKETIPLPAIPAQQGAAVNDATRVLELSSAVAAPAPTPIVEQVETADDQLPNQLTLEEFMRVEDVEDAGTASEVPHEELLKRAREERVRDFTLDGEEEEPNEPEEEALPDPEEEPEIEDFTTYEDSKAVQHELGYRSRTALLTLLFTGVLELVLFLLTVLTLVIGQSPITEMGYLTVHLFGLGLMLVLNFSAVSRGLSGLFALRANADTGAALAVSVALCNGILHFVDISQPMPYWAPVAGLLMLFNAAGHYARAELIRKNFAFVSYPGAKYTACLIKDEKAQREIGRRAVAEGEADVAYFRRADFLSSYLANANEDDCADGWMKWLAPLSFGLSLILSLILVFTGVLEGFWDWMRAFVGMLCVSMPAASLPVQLALNQCSSHMLARGGFMVGWKAVRQFGKPDALAVDVADLYPDESMLLHGIKTFGGAHIDDAILDAASLAVRSEGPLSLIFRRIIENRENLLRKVDNLVYEQGMGLSGWVNDRRVLVGNRRLLQHHGVDVPSSDYEARYAKDGRRLVYLATAGELSAMFVVSYLPDKAFKSALQDLCRAKVTLLVRSCDPNITAEDLCRDFELDDYYVDMLPSAAGRQYVQLTEGEAEASADAVLASNGHILGKAFALSACRSLQVKTSIALTLQTVLAVIGLVLSSIWLGKGLLVFFLSVLLYTVVSALLSWVVPLLRRI